MVTTRLMTIAEFATLSNVFKRYELVRGELREVQPEGMRHGEIGSMFALHIGTFVRTHRLGETYISNTGFILDGSHRPVVLMPDASFVRADRLPAEVSDDFPPRPDLAVEVVSPIHRHQDIEERIGLYMAAGVPLLWYCEPKPRTVTVYRPGRAPIVVGEDGELDGEDVLPGFRLRVADVFVI